MSLVYNSLVTSAPVQQHIGSAHINRTCLIDCMTSLYIFVWLIEELAYSGELPLLLLLQYLHSFNYFFYYFLSFSCCCYFCRHVMLFGCLKTYSTFGQRERQVTRGYKTEKVRNKDWGILIKDYSRRGQ